MRYTLRRRLERLATDRWARRSLRTLLRSAWVGLALMCVGLGVQMVLGWHITVELLGALALACVAVGAIRLLRPRLPVPAVARQLDHRFDLHEQLATALEVSQRGTPEGVEVRLLEQAHMTTTQVQQHIARQRRYPWSEIAALLAVACLVLGMLLLTMLFDPGRQLAAEPLPPLVPPTDMSNPPRPETPPDQPQPEQAGGQGTTGAADAAGGFDQQSAEALADAMRDQSATRPAAEALDRNDAAGAAQRLRELADQSGQLSDDTRRDLANELRGAAAEIEGSNPELAEQVRESAYGLQQEGQSTAEAFENLADAMQQLDGAPQQAQQGEPGEPGQPDQSQPGVPGQRGGGAASNAPFSGQRELPQPSERLGVDGVPLELESQGDGQTPSQGDPATLAPGGGSFEPGEGTPGDAATIQIGEDPLRIPADLRDVVQEYFSPTP